jgi:hypothetical protein
MKLVVRNPVLWQLHVLLVEQKQRAMQLVARRMIDPASALAIGGAVLGIGCRRQSPRSRHEIGLGRWIAAQEFIERRMSQDSAEPLG